MYPQHPVYFEAQAMWFERGLGPRVAYDKSRVAYAYHDFTQAQPELTERIFSAFSCDTEGSTVDVRAALRAGAARGGGRNLAMA